MKITIINGSPRKNGNTQIMAEEFARGARESGHTVDLINLAEKQIAGCKGCQYCFAHDGVCSQEDDMADILANLDQADMAVFASPIYCNDVTAQLKAAIDRLYARMQKGFHFSQTALLLDAASPGTFDAAIVMYKGMAAYVKWEDKGILAISGMTTKGSMKDSPDLAKAYELGKAL